MIRRVTLCLFLVASCDLPAFADPVPTTGPATKRLASDATELPPVGERKFKFKLPIIGEALGSTPEEVCGVFEILNESRSGARIDALAPGLAWYDLSRYQGPAGFRNRQRTIFFSSGPFRAPLISFHLDQGRVVRLSLFYSQLSPNDFRALESRLQPLVAGKPEVIRNDRGGPVGTRMRLGGGKSSKLPIGVWCTIWNVELPRPTGPRDYCIVFELDMVEWYLAYHETPEEIAEAMRSGKPTPGMTYEQVTSMVIGRQNKHLYPPKDKPNEGVKVLWYEYSDTWKELVVVARAEFDVQQKLVKFETWSPAARDVPRLKDFP